MSLFRGRLLDKSYNAALKTSVIQLTRILDRDLSSRHAVALIYIVDQVDDVLWSRIDQDRSNGGCTRRVVAELWQSCGRTSHSKVL
jgi:hypothetical protein